MSSPCKNCVCLAICKYKTYVCLLSECALIAGFLFRKRSGTQQEHTDHFNKAIATIEEDIEPDRWYVDKAGTPEDAVFSISLKKGSYYD